MLLGASVRRKLKVMKLMKVEWLIGGIINEKFVI